MRSGLFLSILFLAGLSKAEDAPTYESAVKPILKKHCAACHNPEKARGELDVTTYAATMVGGVSGKSVVKGKPAESPLYLHTAHLEEPKMPPNAPKIPQADLNVLKAWIEGGLLEKGTGAVSKKAAVTGGMAAAVPLARSAPVTALAVHPFKTVLAVPGRRQVLIYDLKAGRWLGGIPFAEGDVQCIRFSNDGSLMIVGGGVGGQSGLVAGYRTDNWDRVFKVGDEPDAVLACDISSDKSLIVLGGPTRAVKVFAVADGKLLQTFRKPTDWVTAVGFSPDGLLVAAGDRFGAGFLWETESGKEYALLRGHSKGVTALAWRPDGNALATASEDGTVRLWDAHTATETKNWKAHAPGVLDISFASADRIATGGRDGFARIWNLEGITVFEGGPAKDQVLKVAVAGKEVFTADASGIIKRSSDGKGTEIFRPLAAAAKGAQVVLPPTPTRMVAAVDKPVDGVEAASKELATAQGRFDNAKREMARAAAAVGLAHLKVAAANDPMNNALTKAVAEAEAAVKSLESPR